MIAAGERSRRALGGACSWSEVATAGTLGCFPVTDWHDLGGVMLAGLASVRGIAVIVPWLVFLVAVIWMSCRVSTRPVVAHDPKGSRLMVAQYVLFFTMLVHSLLFWRAEVTTAVAIVGTVLLFVGATFYLSVLPHLLRGYSPMVSVRAGHELCTRGPYRLVRHPSYASQMLMMAGTGLVTQHYDFLALPIAFYVMVRTARAEEELLAQQFPEYAHYRQKTGMLLPRLPRAQGSVAPTMRG
jgi:protein-S-isoprenylcysteine O-methyltransferase Ste14